MILFRNVQQAERKLLPYKTRSTVRR